MGPIHNGGPEPSARQRGSPSQARRRPLRRPHPYIQGRFLGDGLTFGIAPHTLVESVTAVGSAADGVVAKLAARRRGDARGGAACGGTASSGSRARVEDQDAQGGGVAEPAAAARRRWQGGGGGGGINRRRC